VPYLRGRRWVEAVSKQTPGKNVGLRREKSTGNENI
jgi:hypothetical protein